MKNDIISHYNKTDIAFSIGYRKFRLNYRLEILLHVLQTLGFIVFIPIYSALLKIGDKALAAEIVALIASIISTLIVICKYYCMFVWQGLQTYCMVARETGHATTQPIISAESEQNCTSQIVLDANSGVIVEGVQQREVDTYGKMVKNQIYLAYIQKFRYLNSLEKFQINIGIVSMITIIVLMAKSQYLNKVEIAVLLIYIIFQAVSKLSVIGWMLLIGTSPILCIFYAFYKCCFKKENELDLQAKSAQTKDVINCEVTCKICFQDIKIGDDIYNTLPCSQEHIFHRRCLDIWSKLKETCRICKADLPYKNLQNQQNQINQIQPQTP